MEDFNYEKMSKDDVIGLLLTKETEISNKFHHAISEILRLGYDSERGSEQIPDLVESVVYSLEEIKRIVSR